jgi:site-specific DNA recombinase
MGSWLGRRECVAPPRKSRCRPPRRGAPCTTLRGIRFGRYARTDEEHQPYSLEAQDTRLGAYIASQDGWELTRSYSDRMTGSVLERV